MREELTQGLNKVKGGLRSAWERLSENDYELPRKTAASVTGFVHGKVQGLKSKKGQKSSTEEGIDKVPLSDSPIDLDTAKEQDRGEGVKFYDTENSEAARGAEKVVPRGLDSFGEKDTFEFDEADDYQTDRDRNQNSDLSKRFYTHGLSETEKEKRH